MHSNASLLSKNLHWIAHLQPNPFLHSVQMFPSAWICSTSRGGTDPSKPIVAAAAYPGTKKRFPFLTVELQTFQGSNPKPSSGYSAGWASLPVLVYVRIALWVSQQKTNTSNRTFMLIYVTWNTMLFNIHFTHSSTSQCWIKSRDVQNENVHVRIGL